jgi:cation transport regulator ChaB
MATKREELPGTVRRSPARTQRTYRKALRSAHREYDSEERAHRTAYAALKHSFRKVGDHWEPKQRRGPSDPQARQGGRQAREHPKRTYGGIDVAHSTRRELYERAKELDVPGRSHMDERELAAAVARKR